MRSYFDLLGSASTVDSGRHDGGTQQKNITKPVFEQLSVDESFLPNDLDFVSCVRVEVLIDRLERSANAETSLASVASPERLGEQI